MALPKERAEQSEHLGANAKAAPRFGALPLPLIIGQALERLQSGETARALEILAQAPADAHTNALACRAFPLIYVSAGDYGKAVQWFDHALRLNPGQPDVLAGKGTALQGEGRQSEAVASFDLALALRPNDPESWYNRGVALDALGEIELALQSYETAIAQRSSYLWAMSRHCEALAKLGRLTEALAEAVTLTSLMPQSPDAWCRRGNIEQELGRYGEALTSYGKALVLRPTFASALINRGTALQALGRQEEALSDLETALQIVSGQSEALIARANILQGLGRESEAEADYRRALAHQPLITQSAIRSKPEFRALFLFAPSAGNTPIDDMIRSAECESNTLILLPGIDYDTESLGARADIVVNLVSDADRGQATFTQVADLAARLGKPVINPPEKVSMTDRATVARFLAPLEGCRVPRTQRFTSDDLGRAMADRSFDIPFPLVARVAGTHGGEKMERLDHRSDLEAFAGANPAADIYVSEYIDYRSNDGFFRKYRFIFVGEEILPYHLAIGDHWKVHHATTNMASEPWLQREEECFLANPATVFGPAAFAALRKVRAAVDLDYFGIDCALDRDGGVVIFEVNASMLVHLRNEAFPYKDGPVRRIKAAFASLLKSRALGASEPRLVP